VTGTMKSA